MLTIEKVNKVFNVLEKEYPALWKDISSISTITVGNKFCAKNFDTEYSFDYEIMIEEELTDKLFLKYIKEYLLNKGLEVNKYKYKIKNLYELFALLHEIGHIVYREYLHDSDKEYIEYHNINAESYEEKDLFYKYRNIPFEKMADDFAIDIIKKHSLKFKRILNTED